MHRMRRPFVIAALVSLSITLATTRNAQAALLEPDHTRNFPDVTAFTNGYQTYKVDSSSSQGTFLLKNIPFLLTTGQSGNDFVEFDVSRASNGQLSQNLTAIVNAQTGALVPGDSRNAFSLYGKVTLDGETFDGLLLQGTPTAFGFQDLGVAGVGGKSLFDLKVKITGGLLADLFGAEAYLSVTSDANSTFNGVFTKDFSSQKILTNLQKVNPNHSPVPEPSTLVVLVAAGAGLLLRNRRRITRADLEAPTA